MKISLVIYFTLVWFVAALSGPAPSPIDLTGYQSSRYGSIHTHFSSPANAPAAASELTLVVRNVNSVLKSGALVKLYNASDGSLVNSQTTNSSGQVVFSELPDGKYNYNVSYKASTSTPVVNNTEFWGSGQVTINGSSQEIIFTRNQPTITVEASFTPSIVAPGQATAGSFSVKNTLSSPVDAYVSVWLDRDKSSNWDIGLDIPAKIINPVSTTKYPFTASPLLPGTYHCYAYVYTRVGDNYLITDQYSWYQAFQVNDALGHISVLLPDPNHTTNALSSNRIIRYDLSNTPLDSELTDNFGKVTFTNIAPGTYSFEGYHLSTDPMWGGDLYRGSTQGTVTAGATSAVTILPSEPVIENIVVNGTVFGPGSMVHVDVTVKNPGTVARTCKAAIRVDRDQQGAFDYNPGFQGPFILPAGQSRVFGFDWAIPLDAVPGTFYIASCVQGLYDKGYLNTDATLWEDSIKNDNTTVSQIQWSGYIWNVKSGTGLGPGPNDWLANSSSVWVDEEGNLHLKIRKIGNKWYCASINTKPLHGYGDYTFQVSSPVENLDKNVVLGLFTYETDLREIDMEFSRWSDPLSQMGWYNVQPSSAASHHGFDLNLRDSFSTHKFQWSASKVFFQSYQGHHPYLPGKEQLITEWTYKGANIPPPGNERLILNLWLFRGTPPSDLKEVEVVLRSVAFHKVGDLVIQLYNASQPFLPATGSNGIVKLYNRENALVSTGQSNEEGEVTFAGLSVGEGYSYQVFHLPANGSPIDDLEYWGSMTDVYVNDEQTTTSTFRRDQPTTGMVKVFNGSTDVTEQLIEPGTHLRIEQQIINPSSQDKQVAGSLLLDMDQSGWFDFRLTDNLFLPIAANGAVTQSFPMTPTIKGPYYASGRVHTAVQTEVLLTGRDPWSTSPLFTVSPSFNLNMVSDPGQQLTQHSTASWVFRLQNTADEHNDFSLKSDWGSFFYEGQPVINSPVLMPQQEIELEFRFDSEERLPGTQGQITFSVGSNNDPNRVKVMEVDYTIIVSALVLTTREVSSIAFYTATGGGTVVHDGGTTISEKGICWGLTPYPTVFLGTKTSDGPGSAFFSSLMTGLTNGTTYHVRAYAINSVGVAYGNDVFFTTVVFNPPVARFAEMANTGCLPLKVQFMDQSSASPTSWAWDIDNDGSVDYTTQDPIHTYQVAGSYSVKLTVANNSASDSVTVSDYVTVQPLLEPKVSISALPSQQTEVGQLVSFTAMPTNGGTNPLFEWRIDGWMAGVNSSNFSTTGLTNGQIVSCLMTSSEKCVHPQVVTSNAITMEVRSLNRMASAKAGTDQTVNEGTLVTLDGTASTDPDNDQLSYAWTAPSGVALSSTTLPKPMFTAPEIKKDSFLNFYLTVHDGRLYSLPSSVKIFVKNVIKTSTHALPVEGLKIYPNPTSGIFIIEGMQAHGDNFIEVYSMDGSSILKKITPSSACKIDISQHPPGAYLVMVNQQTIRVVKE